MRVPLTTRDFVDRAELVYADRIGIVDEPTQPAPSLGEVSYREVARRGRALQAGLDELGIGEGERVAIVSHNAGRLLELLLAVPSSGRVAVPINFRLSQDEVREVVVRRGFGVDDDEPRAGADGDIGQPGRRPHLQRGADGEEDVAVGRGRGARLDHGLVEHLPEVDGRRLQDVAAD